MTMPVYRFESLPHGRVQLVGASSAQGIERDEHFYVNDQLVSEVLWNGVPREMSDLLDVAVAVYLADRLARRHVPGNRYEHHWRRGMHVKVPVRDVPLWRSARVTDALERALGYLTEDAWSFEFVQRPPNRGRVSEGVHYLFPPDLENPILVALFSGGLDSLAGFAKDLETHRSGGIVLVSANTNRNVTAIQRVLVEEIRQRTGRRVHWTVAYFGMRRRAKKSYDGEENTQRTRGFAFTTIGAVSALVAGAHSLRLYENGVGAINLPYSNVQLGAQSTRAMHPESVRRMEELIVAATGQQLRLELPALFATKGELCAALARSSMRDLAEWTMSCDTYRREAGAKQCGTCTSCLLRREAMLAAGLRDDLGPRDDHGYVFDIYKRFRTLSDDKRVSVRAMLDQGHRIRKATGEPGAVDADSWRRLVREFPVLMDLPESVSSRGVELAQMYARYGDEVARFEAKIHASRP